MEKADYKSMYLEIFNSITDAVDILQNAQKQVEEIYILTADDEEEQ